MSEIPDGVVVEPVFVLQVPYTAEAPARRPAARREHLARIARLIREGVVIEAGGCADFSSAILLLRVRDEAEAMRLYEEDVYTRAGVWHEPTIRAFGRVRPEDGS